MEHHEAVKQMAAERYLLDELLPEARDAFEEHLFDCSECALDVRAGVAFVDEAKAQLPELTTTFPAPTRAATDKPKVKRKEWFSWWNPSFAAPAFATLLLVLGYQNLVTYPALRVAANQPHLLPSPVLRGATRGGAPTTVLADRKLGFVLPVDLDSPSGFVSYRFDLDDSQGKRVWTFTAAPLRGPDSGTTDFSLLVPSAGLMPGTYTLAISGISIHGESIEIDRRSFNLRYND